MRILVETITGAGVGVGSPPRMPQAMVTGRTSVHTRRRTELLERIAKSTGFGGYCTSMRS